MTQSSCILVAEDQEVDVFLLKRAFRQAGLSYNLTDVPDGEKAVQYLKGNPPFDDRVKFPFPQLLLLDLKMPKMNGFDVLAWIAGRPDMHSLPVVVLTSSPLESDVRMAFKLGANCFLTKPTDLDEMVGIVKYVSQSLLADPAGFRQGERSASISWKSVPLANVSKAPMVPVNIPRPQSAP